ncbi:NGG1p interacting factor NIF3 [Marinibactrum halimedae]|uniref:NGG1p interacting factor NIF3 n=1 Tax=Marinibactrum halimedae TaxID=1444977 RepID=A0AA37WLW4_9GAMM|nr:NGG1p interacting factor NIF3 [Marinibactrum halimedae]MCD9460066.1 NGG1p interacting factor NIF3 [Marinibactrum halimedae]GLS26464.1 hypothetical protein GCM10007877_21800 [Marinibactrum halimedae]
MFQIIVYVPNSHKDEVKGALFSAGAGAIGDYTECCWEVEGVGQFRPGSGSQPYIGELNTLERVAETKLELVCEEKVLNSAISAMIEAHPYEEPAYFVFRSFELR